MRKITMTFLVLTLMITFAVSGYVSAQDQKPEKLVLGMVPSREASKLVNDLEPLADILAEELGVEVDHYISTSYTGLIEAIGTGKIDIGLFGPFAMVLADQRHDVNFLVNTVRYGASKYRGQFMVQSDSGIESVEDLEGKTLAFTDPASTSGYLFPYVYLKNKIGLDPENDMQTTFAGGHDAAALALYNGDVDAAVTFEDARGSIEEEYPDVMEKLKVIGYTNYIPNDGLIARRGLSDQFTQKIEEVFLNIGDTDQEVAMLDSIFNASGFEKVTSEDYDVVRETYEEMKDQIEGL
ncbi:MAG: phosphate/phosphite/phosphonate ABC transporter substrate-binding protein [Halanaerobiales bacterium]|nr:phosphate/phosphite/phosphonate ABC transporter substrate-binding protein [Halanaerobiales bacterium]